MESANNSKKRVLLLCGGRSTEHEISIVSCLSVRAAIDMERFAPVVAGIGRDGVWKFYGDGEFARRGCDARHTSLIEDAPECFPVCDSRGTALMTAAGERIPFDIVFPVLHGAYGEDGAIQGLFAMLNVPCVGCDFTSSANCMDKALTKTLAEKAGIATAGGIVVLSAEDPALDDAAERFGLPLFVKPAKSGSSVGITRVTEAGNLRAAVAEALRYDSKVLVEPAVRGREIECAVLERPDGSLFVAEPGEVVANDDFYSYDAKYINAAAATVVARAELDGNVSAQIRETAAKAFRELGCGGMARVDFFLSPERGIVLNEINTIPGFTSISLYPQMMAKSGIPYPELISTLLETARCTFEKRKSFVC